MTDDNDTSDRKRNADEKGGVDSGGGGGGGGGGIKVPAGRVTLTGHAPTVFISSPYEATATGAVTVTERKAILDLPEAFRDFDDSVVYTLAHDQEPVGPRIGVDNVPETTLKAAANFESMSRERESTFRERSRERRRDNWRWGIALAVTAALGIISWLR